MDELIAKLEAATEGSRDLSMTPLNLVHIALAHLDRTMLTSPDGNRVEVNLEAIARLVANPPAMLTAAKAQTSE